MTFLRIDGQKPHRKDGFYSTKAWLKLRAKVAKLAGHKCAICGCHASGRGNGIADHIVSRVKRPDLALEISNLQWLCTSCHNSVKQSLERGPARPPVGDDGLPPGWDDQPIAFPGKTRKR